MGLFGPSQSELIELFKKSDDGCVEKRFANIAKDAKQNQKARYSIDMSSIYQFANLVSGLKASEIQRGIQMQSEKGPQKDWAIAGGIASGLLGGMAGAAVAMSTMQENIAATAKHHETGRRMVENGVNAINSINRDMEELNQIAVDINSTDNFEFTSVLPDLINCFECESVSIISYEGTQVYKIKTFGGLETYTLNKLIAYNAIGFFEADISVKNNFCKVFPKEKTKRIDGTFRISLYDGTKEIAYGYIFGDDWSADNLGKAGFRESFQRKVLFKLIDRQTVVTSNKTYTAKFSEPNLWLVQPIR